MNVLLVQQPINSVESELTELKSQLNHVEKQLQSVESDLEELKPKLKALEAKAVLTEDDKHDLVRLRDEKKQLRDKEILLLNEKERPPSQAQISCIRCCSAVSQEFICAVFLSFFALLFLFALLF